MATKDKASLEQPGAEHHREVTNTGGRLARDPSDEYGEGGRAQPGGERGENAEPMRRGNQPRPRRGR